MDESRPRSWLSRALRRSFLVIVPIPLTLAGAVWWFTAPLESLPASQAAASEPPPAAPSLAPTAAKAPALGEGGVVSSRLVAPEWPNSRLDGDEAKRFLLEYLRESVDRMSKTSAYRASFAKQERMRGRLGPLEKIELKVRHEPFSVYMRFLTHEPGKEVIFHEGRFDNDVVAHNGGLARRLLPRVKVSPTSKIALANSRHPITDTGLHNLVRKLVRYRELDLGDEHAETILDTFIDEEGRLWHRAEHLHRVYSSDRPFARCIVLFDPATHLPLRFQGYEWPDPGATDQDLMLGESYAYDDLQLDAPLADTDFDPANPEYQFTRF